MRRNFTLSLCAVAGLFAAISCKWMQPESNVSAGDPQAAASPTATPTPIGDIRGTTAKRAFRIEGDIDDARQEGDVCDTSKKFKVPGTLEFEFTPNDAMKGTYTYSAHSMQQARGRTRSVRTARCWSMAPAASWASVLPTRTNGRPRRSILLRAKKNEYELLLRKFRSRVS